MFMVMVMVEYPRINTRGEEDRWTRNSRIDWSPWVQRKRLVQP